jgi:cobalt-zinc-cadmium efflux system membrane fusion protein
MNKTLLPSVLLSTLLSAFASTVTAAEAGSQFAVPEAQIKAMGITTVALQTGEGSVRKSFPAQIRVPPNAEQIVSSAVAGLVKQLLVEQNQTVKAGDPLLRLASPEFGQLQLTLLQASAQATLARQNAQREKQLFEEGIVAQRRQQESQAQLSEAEATLKQAKAALRLSGMPAAAIDRVIASGSPQEDLTLVAAVSGIVVEVDAKLGERVDAASALMRVVQPEVLWADIQVPVSDSAAWPAGTPVTVKGRKATGRVLSSGVTVSANSQTVLVRAQIDGSAADLRPGEVVAAELPVGTGKGGWELPLAAVAHDGDKAVVFVRTKDGFDARPVTISDSAGQRVRVDGPLKAGEAVAVSSVVALKGAWLKSQEAE